MKLRTSYRIALQFCVLALWCGVAHPQTDADLRSFSAWERSFVSHLRAGRYADAENNAQQALVLVRRRFSRRPKLEALWLMRLGAVYSELQKVKEAQTALNGALKIYRRHSGPESTDVAGVLLNLSNTYEFQGRYEDSEKTLRDAIAIFEKSVVGEPDNKKYLLETLASCFSNLGNLCAVRAKYEEAEKSCLRALEVLAKVEPTVPLRIADVHLNLGSLSTAKLNAILANDNETGALQLLRHSDREEQLSDAHQKLAALWQLLIPADARESLVSGKLQRLYIIPDGALTSLPFEALIVDQADEPVYLLDVGPPTIYAPSATILVNLTNRKIVPTQNGQRVLSVGDPTYDTRNTQAGSSRTTASTRSRYHRFGGALERLPHSGTESTWVKQVFAKHGIGSVQLRRSEATEAQVRQQISGRRVVHLACHGLADQSHGNLFGALALAPNPRVRSVIDDGFLSLAEIYGLKMSNCELTILSACDTNFGPHQRGEGVWSLSRGFLVAGSRRVVASNWYVDDRAAASLVSYFCSGIAKEEGNSEIADYAEKLHKAKKWVRGQENWASPYYWATFVLIGPN